MEKRFCYPLWTLLRSVPESWEGSRFAYLESDHPLPKKATWLSPKYELALELLRRFVRRNDVLVVDAPALYTAIFRREGYQTSSEMESKLELLLPQPHNAIGRLRVSQFGPTYITADHMVIPDMPWPDLKRLRRAIDLRDKEMRKRTFQVMPREEQRMTIIMTEMRGIL